MGAVDVDITGLTGIVKIRNSSRTYSPPCCCCTRITEARCGSFRCRLTGRHGTDRLSDEEQFLMSGGASSIADVDHFEQLATALSSVGIFVP